MSAAWGAATRMCGAGDDLYTHNGLLEHFILVLARPVEGEGEPLREVGLGLEKDHVLLLSVTAILWPRLSG